MKTFIKNVLAFILMIAVIVFAMSRVYDARNPYNDGTLPYFKMPEEIVVANLGSSHGQNSFLWPDETRMFNFAMSSQTLSYDYRIFQEYADHMAEGSTVFIVVSLFSFCQDEYEEESFWAKNLRYYKVLPPDKIKKYSMFDDYFYRCFSILNPTNRHLSRIVEALRGQKEEYDGIATKESIISAMLTADRDEMIYSNEAEDINEEELEALCGIIELCRERNITPILITTPYTAEYNKFIPGSVWSNWYTIIQEIQEKYEVEYWDYSHDREFTEHYEYFLDWFHLNKQGAKVFTEKILVRLGDNCHTFNLEEK